MTAASTHSSTPLIHILVAIIVFSHVGNPQHEIFLNLWCVVDEMTFEKSSRSESILVAVGHTASAASS